MGRALRTPPRWPSNPQLKENLTTMNPTIKQSFVYVIHAQGTPRVKLGVTTDVESRLRAIQTGCPYKCVVLAKWPGSPRLERKLHEYFKEHRKHGEWFELPPYSGKAIYDIVMSHETGTHPQARERRVRRSPFSAEASPVPTLRRKDVPPRPSLPADVCAYLEWRAQISKAGMAFELLIRPFRQVDGKKVREKALYALYLSAERWIEMQSWTDEYRLKFVQSEFDRKARETGMLDGLPRSKDIRRRTRDR